ncbi:MAG: methylmalonyl Co-A mutase-associated GTPase MeaB [Ferruginibacter sp.]|nr:methylmalonyl Co-A mutase-associated GTPase MeaB [Ferruginibacter sp.]NOU38844.1 methylmalonyl Co-A mutase-associated GTPase MeaB [Ferruginibacter sp.]
MWSTTLIDIKTGDRKSLSRAISLIENEFEGYDTFLQNLDFNNTPIIGITGPPGAGKSTITDALIAALVNSSKKVAVLCVDPSSPFNLGALLGDRIRMNRWYNEPNVYIRSLATRGALGGLHPKILEITDIIKIADFDYIIIETVGVGQSEIEIAGLADVTILVLVPEAGDEIQTMKAGIMEIADVFVVNKADRPGADTFVKNLKQMLAPAFSNRLEEIKVLKTIASKNAGIEELKNEIDYLVSQDIKKDKKIWLLVEKIYYLLQKQRMKLFNKNEIKKAIEHLPNEFNVYRAVADILKQAN